MMVLQELQFPNLETCSSFEMYFHTDEGPKHAYSDVDAAVVRVPQWCHLDLDTYFNAFSIGKWRKYTWLDNLSLRLVLSGEFRVQLVHWTRMKGHCSCEVVGERMCRAAEAETFEIAFPAQLASRGIYACTLYAVGEDCAFHGGCYVTEIDDARLNPVDIALGICTYKREAFVEHNLGVLRRDILDNPQSPLYNHIEVFIADNGRTLDIPRLAAGPVHIFPNRNAGGSGGFARDMMEIIDAPRAFSHVLLMDDDVVIGADALVRTYRLLRLLRPEYAGKTIAGAMLRLDERWRQHECCGWWMNRIYWAGKHDLDLRKMEMLLVNEQEESFDYNAWWYSCIPMSKISNESLPMPFFVRMDDVEFGLRTGGDILAMNGICLWHEPFEYKFASSMNYYMIRNLMLVNAIHRPGAGLRSASFQMSYLIRTNVEAYRYKDCELVFRGVEDFLEGADTLFARDPEALHNELRAASDKLLPLRELEIPFRESEYNKNLQKRRAIVTRLRLMLMNGLFFPSKGKTVVEAHIPQRWACYRRSALLNYDEANDCGFVTKRSLVKSASVLCRLVGGLVKLRFRYPAAAESYQKAYRKLTSREFWDRYLGLKQ